MSTETTETLPEDPGPASGTTEAAPLDTAPSAGLVIIGNEILSGRTQDANTAFLGRSLADMGIRLLEIRVVPDVLDAVVEAVNTLRERYTYVFTTGGIGPTHDDITADCVAAAFGVPLLEDPRALDRLLAHYADPSQLNAARRRMARIPEGADLIDNPVSGAPGFRIGNVHVLAGVPKIMQAMFDGVKHTLVGGAPVLSVSVSATVREGDMAEELGAIQVSFPETDIGSYPFAKGNRIGASVVIRGTNRDQLAAAADQVAAMMEALGETPEITWNAGGGSGNG